MNRKILFTPVGGTDPISSTNCYDGAILHICRHYKPDKVIMYMSKEMLENQEKMIDTDIVWTNFAICRNVL